MDEIQRIASAHGIPIVEDAAHALPASYRGQMIGTISDATCFSFYANKTMTTGEGGIVTTSDLELSERIRQLSLHGLSKDAWGRFRTNSPWDYSIVEPGYKYNATDISSAIGMAQLRRVDHSRELRARQAQRYDEHFSGYPAIQPLSVSAANKHAYHLYVVVLNTDQTKATRDEIIDNLRRNGIGTSVHYRPLHLHGLYRDRYGYTPSDFPVATSMFSRVISLPIYPSLATTDLDRVADTLKRVVGSTINP
jgi:perosamine synthetase